MCKKNLSVIITVLLVISLLTGCEKERVDPVDELTGNYGLIVEGDVFDSSGKKIVAFSGLDEPRLIIKKIGKRSCSLISSPYEDGTSLYDIIGVIDKKGNFLLANSYSEIYYPTEGVLVQFTFSHDPVKYNHRKDRVLEWYSHVTIKIIYDDGKEETGTGRILNQAFKR